MPRSVQQRTPQYLRLMRNKKQLENGVRMKKQIFVAGAISLCLIAIGAVEGYAQQIFNQFRQPELIVGRPYRDIDACPVSQLNKIVMPAASFVLPPVNTVDTDDGYAYLQFPASFRFRYNGTQFPGLYVSVNGFVTFDGTKLVPAKQSVGLFINSSSYPDNVIAPFWGDHRYRQNIDQLNGYMPSEISWVIDVDRDENCDTIKPVRRCLIIQWKNLNINDASINSSVGNFQARLYEAPDSDNNQGEIRFAYGQVGGNPNTQNTIVVTRGATVGIKGNGGFPGFLSDFWNGLVYSPALGANSRTDSTSVWQPSGGRSDAQIQFRSIVFLTFDVWGYGDADTSGARGQRHDNLGRVQNRVVTANDARVILRSMVTKRYLDSVWKRQAYQGDVNHSGRFYYTKLKRDFSGDSIVNNQIVIWRRTIDIDQFYPNTSPSPINTSGKQVLFVMNEDQGLFGVGGRAPDVSNINQIYYEVTEYDASLILRYLSGRLPYLPWIVYSDTTGPDQGKVKLGSQQAYGFHFGTPVSIGNDLVRLPVYLNQSTNEPFGAKFETPGIVEVTGVNSGDNNVSVDYSNNVAVVTGYGEFNTESPVAFATVKASDVVTFTGVRFNEVNSGDVTVNVVENSAAQAVSLYPNPTTSGTQVAFDAKVEGFVTVRVYDSYGKLVTNLFEGNVAAGTMSTNWNGTNSSGIAVAAGSYVVRVDGAGVSASTLVNVVR